MKKNMLLLIVIFMSCFLMNVFALNEKKYIDLDNVTTNNFFEKVNYSVNDIKELCTYDFCDYIKSQNKYEMIEIFQKNYLNTIKDDEIKSSLKIKGIKITKIILNK